MAVYLLDDGLWFPDPHLGEEDGLVAVGGDLSPQRLLLAYSYGFFPWYSYKQGKEPWWYCPLDRFVIFPNEIHISHSMKQLMRQQTYQVTFNQDFQGVMRGCMTADQRNQDDYAWLGPHIIKAYTQLHKMGFAASVEVWEEEPQKSEAAKLDTQDEAAKLDTQGDGEKHAPQKTVGHRLVGGLYGVTLRNAFFGESMFSLVPNASKLALIHLAQTLAHTNAHFIDCQFETPHLKSMGGRHISYEEYMERIKSEK